MKKKMILFLALLSACAIGVHAEHVHDWSGWEYINKDNSYHYEIRYCYDCDQEEKHVAPHNLLSVPNYYDSDDKNTCYAYYTCKKCGEYIKKATTHKFAYVKSDGTICCKCKNCGFVYGDDYIPVKYTVKANIKKGKTATATVPLLRKDKIKTYKVVSGKKLISIKKKSKKKLLIKAKKKGKAKFKVKLLSGATFIYVLKIK